MVDAGYTNETIDKIRILVADDHFVVRIGLTALVNTDPDMEVVAEAADGEQAIELFAKSTRTSS